jgi:hypothetical protein
MINEKVSVKIAKQLVEEQNKMAQMSLEISKRQEEYWALAVNVDKLQGELASIVLHENVKGEGK